MSDERLLCPVCDCQIDTTDDMNGACHVCGFPYPSIRMFTSRESRNEWRSLVVEYSVSRLQRVRSGFASGKRFATMRSEVYFLDNNHVLYACSSKGMSPIAEGIRTFSVSGRTLATVTTDGALRLRSSGTWSTPVDDSFIDVETSSDCTYAIRRNGTVFVFGICAFREEVERWHDVVELSVGLFHLAARLVDGTVRFAGSIFAQDIFKRRNSWRRITKLASSSDCTFGLTKDGKVEYAGPNGIFSNVGDWKDILSIAVEENYVVGLNRDGKLVLEARVCSNAARDVKHNATAWSDVVAITCGRSCIAAIDSRGQLHMEPESPLRRKMIEEWDSKIVLGGINRDAFIID